MSVRSSGPAGIVEIPDAPGWDWRMAQAEEIVRLQKREAEARRIIKYLWAHTFFTGTPRKVWGRRIEKWLGDA